MGLAEDVATEVNVITKTPWSIRDSKSVPDADDIALKRNGAVRLDATYVYADLAKSSELAQRAFPQVTGQIIRCYINTAARILKAHGGAIRSFDGDRVMAIYVGDNRNYAGVKAALTLQWAVHLVLNPALTATWSDLNSFWRMEHAVGVATGPCLIARGGVYGDNDLISIGQAPNLAAKLSDVRNGRHSIFITENVYSTLPSELRLVKVPSIYPGMYPSTQVREMWAPLGQHNIGGTFVHYRGTEDHWNPIG